MTTLVAPAEIARLAGVTRAAVSNWRRRYTDFPAPAGGSNTSPLFDLDEVQRWLEVQRKGRPMTEEVRLWQALRAHWPEDMAPALAAVAAHLSGERPLPDELLKSLEGVAESPGDLLDELIQRFVTAESERITKPDLVRIVAEFAGPTNGTVYDPACGVGDLLLAVGGAEVTERHGQDIDTGLAELVRLRGVLAAPPQQVSTASGDALRHDAFPDLKADLVVCEPPTGQPDWGRDDLLLDRRWELGLPPKAESDLAWLQHCYFHTAPGGRALVVLPAAASYRRSGRRIRAELLRSGALHTLVALPGGLAASHAAPLHLWILYRRLRPTEQEARITMIDLSEADLSRPYEPAPAQTAEIPAISLLDDDVNLSPAHHVAAASPAQAQEYEQARSRFAELLRSLSLGLPSLSEGSGELVATVNIADLLKGGLVELRDGEPVSITDQLDTDFLRGFLHSPANVRRSTSGSGTYRTDARGARVPQMDPALQREYGAVFRRLETFLNTLEDAAREGRSAVRLAQEGLTGGTLDPAERDA